MRGGWLLLLLWLPLAAAGQSAIPAGTVLPVRLETGLNLKKVRAGKRIRARVMQNIPGTSIHRGAHVVGEVTDAGAGRVGLRFDAVVSHGRQIPMTTSLRALASMLEVEEAAIPEGGADRSLPPELRNSRQIGGEEVYRGGGPVARGLDVVGEPTAYGVLGRLQANGGCRGTVDGNDAPQAVWLFATDACGVYGMEGVKIEHAGRTHPVGTIELASASGKLNIRSGSGLLLRVR